MGNTFWWISFFFFTGTRGGSFFGQTEGGPGREPRRERKDKTRGSGAHRWGFAGRDFCVGLFFFFFLMESFRRGNQEERKGRQRNFSIVFLWFFLVVLFFLGTGTGEKALKGGWRGLVFGIIRVVFFHRKTDFFETPDPLFGWSSGSFTLNKLECSKQAKQHALNTLAWDNGIRPWSCFVGFLGTEVMINRDSRGH